MINIQLLLFLLLLLENMNKHPNQTHRVFELSTHTDTIIECEIRKNRRDDDANVIRTVYT